MTAEEAASYINNGDVVGFGGLVQGLHFHMYVPPNLTVAAPLKKYDGSTGRSALQGGSPFLSGLLKRNFLSFPWGRGRFQ